MMIILLYYRAHGQNVGLGNSSPSSKLDVSGDLALREGTAFTVAAGANSLTLPTAKNSLYRLTGASGAFIISSISAGNNEGFNTNIYNSDGTLAAARTVTMGGNTLTLTGGNLGVGATPSYTMDVSGNLRSTAASYLATGSGFVGIGTTAPTSQLSNTVTNILGTDAIGISNNSMAWATSATGYAVAIYNGNTGAYANGLAVKLAGTAANDRLLDLSTGSSQASAGTSVMVVQGNGYVGIGTASPSAPLHVVSSNNTLFLALGSSSTSNPAIQIGRTAAEATLAVAGGTGGYSSSAVAGDVVLRTESSSARLIFNNASGSAAMSVYNSNVGIGTPSPAYPLDIETSVSASVGGSTYGYLIGSGAGHATSTTGNISLYASQRILSNVEVDVNSDRRIKKDIAHPAPAAMLALANSLHVATYHYIDQFKNGGKQKTGFIAQEVQQALPGAVNMDPGYIPNIYAPALSVELCGTTLQVTTTASHGLSPGDEVRLYDAKNEQYDVCVEEVPGDNTFTVSGWAGPADSLFVYGKKVDDLRNVDFDQITSVSIGAIQELDRKLQEEQRENAALRQQLSAIQEQNKDARLDIDKLKASVEAMQQIIESNAQKLN
ncbi:unnamed protein product [Sphagnum balticum]